MIKNNHLEDLLVHIPRAYLLGSEVLIQHVHSDALGMFILTASWIILKHSAHEPQDRSACYVAF